MTRTPPSPAQLLELADELTRVTARQTRALAEGWIDNRVARAARARVLHPDTPGIADLLAALAHLGRRFPADRSTPLGARAFAAASDLLIATHGHARLSGGQRLTLRLAATHALA